MLHLLSGDIRHLMAAGGGLTANAEISNHAGEGGIANRYSLFICQDLTNALYITITTGIQPVQQIRIYLFPVASGLGGTFAPLSQYFSHYLGRKIEEPGYLFLLFPFLVKHKNCFSLLFVDHKTTSVSL